MIASTLVKGNKSWVGLKVIQQTSSLRYFNTLGGLCLKSGGTVKKTTAFTKKSGPSNTSKRVISLEQVKPENWSLMQATSLMVPEMNVENMVETNENIVFSLPNVLKKSDKLKLLPKFLEREFNFIGEASLLLRNSSLKLINLINEMDAKKQQLPIILDGMSGSGKSSHLLQLVSYSLIKKSWFVIYVPNAINWVNGTSSYNPDIEKDLYQQPQLINEFLKQVQYLNKDNLDKIVLENDVTFNQVKFSKGTKLNQIILNGINDLAVSTDCMKLLFDVLEKQKEFPVLLAIDEINNFYGTTAYFNKNSEPIQATQLSFINQLNQFVSGKKKFNQGLIIGANSTIDLKYSSNEFNNKNNEEEIKYDEFLSRVSENKKIQYQQFNINNFNLKEAESIYKYYNEAHLIFKSFSLKELNRKFLLSNGNPKQFFKSTVCTV